MPKFEMEYLEADPSISCDTCRYLNPEDAEKCLAFFDGIPEEILDGDVDHKSPYPGDNGIQFAPKG